MKLKGMSSISVHLLVVDFLHNCNDVFQRKILRCGSRKIDYNLGVGKLPGRINLFQTPRRYQPVYTVHIFLFFFYIFQI